VVELHVHGGRAVAGALADHRERPQLRFIEKNCVQCGLCAGPCPESAITLVPRLLLAGNGPHHAQLVARTQRLGIGAFVTFLGPQPNHELPHYHAVSDMLVLPSTDHETFGIAACEAMGCGRPVVAAHTGGLPEVVRHGETGLLAAPADATALADAIGTLLGDAALRERMGTAAAEWVRAMFTWDRVVGRVLHSYETALATGAGRE
ncbi:MAG TPA: glycosyltransferase, partial [Roseiflexaceae bacterium]|nr:glycosyltransferase [Roseiflexaceae bacterium]